MTNHNPDPGHDTNLSEIRKIHADMLTLAGLLYAANHSMYHKDRDFALVACLTSAIPVAKKILANMDKVV